jgi:hypothetical protein
VSLLVSLSESPHAANPKTSAQVTQTRMADLSLILSPFVLTHFFVQTGPQPGSRGRAHRSCRPPLNLQCAGTCSCHAHARRLYRMGQSEPIIGELDEHDPVEAIGCRWPLCMLDDDALQNGCPVCRRYRQNLDGTETDFQLKAH